MISSISAVAGTRVVARALDPELAVFISEFEQTEVNPASVSPAERRQAAEEFSPLLRGELSPVLPDERIIVSNESVETSNAGFVPVRVYRRSRDQQAGHPVIVFLHGGGWVAGSLDSYDPDVRRLVEHAGSTVISVGYRLAPEHPFPAGLEDCLGVIRAVAADPRHGKVSVAGDSAGGNLALECAIALTAESVELAALLLLYPVVAHDAIGNRSYRDNGSGYLLTHRDMAYYWEVYDPTGEYEALRVRRGGDLGRLPATVLTTAGFDPLHDEGVQLAQCLVDADVPLTYLPSPSLTHGYQQMVPRIPAAERALDEAYAAFKRAIDSARDGADA